MRHGLWDFISFSLLLPLPASLPVQLAVIWLHLTKPGTKGEGAQRPAEVSPPCCSRFATFPLSPFPRAKEGKIPPPLKGSLCSNLLFHIFRLPSVADPKRAWQGESQKKTPRERPTDTECSWEQGRSPVSHSEKWREEGSSCLDASHQPWLPRLDLVWPWWELVPG